MADEIGHEVSCPTAESVLTTLVRRVNTPRKIFGYYASLRDPKFFLRDVDPPSAPDMEKFLVGSKPNAEISTRVRANNENFAVLSPACSATSECAAAMYVPPSTGTSHAR